MREAEYSGQFKRDVKQAQRRGKDMGKLKTLLGLLIAGAELPECYVDHPLKGDWRVKRHRKLTHHRLPILTLSGRVCKHPANGYAWARSGME